MKHLPPESLRLFRRLIPIGYQITLALINLTAHVPGRVINLLEKAKPFTVIVNSDILHDITRLEVTFRIIGHSQDEFSFNLWRCRLVLIDLEAKVRKLWHRFFFGIKILHFISCRMELDCRIKILTKSTWLDLITAKKYAYFLPLLIDNEKCRRLLTVLIMKLIHRALQFAKHLVVDSGMRSDIGIPHLTLQFLLRGHGRQ